MFFTDYGFTEILPRERLKMMDAKLMETVFLANHCILEGFEDPKRSEEFSKQFGDKVLEKLPPLTETKVKVVKNNKDESYYVIKVKELSDMKPAPVDEKAEAIRALEEQLAKLKGLK